MLQAREGEELLFFKAEPTNRRRDREASGPLKERLAGSG